MRREKDKNEELGWIKKKTFVIEWYNWARRASHFTVNRVVNMLNGKTLWLRSDYKLWAVTRCDDATVC